MLNNRRAKFQSISKVVGTIGGLWGIGAGLFYLFVSFNLFSSLEHHMPNNEDPLVGVIAISGVIIIFLGVRGMKGALLAKKQPRESRRLQTFTAVLYLLMTTINPLILPSILMLATGAVLADWKGNIIYRQQELTAIKEMIENGQYSEALPRLYKLPQSKQDEVERRTLTRICREAVLTKEH